MKTPPPNYFIYERKSMEAEDRQVLSLPAQHTELQSLIKRERCKLADAEPFEESRTAKEPGRPIFNDMLDRIERGEANGIICWDIDRLYRNPIDEGRVRWMLQRGIIVSIRTPGREYTSRDAGLLMAVEGGRAVEHILSMSRNLKRTHEEKLRRGQWPGPKTFGYIFDHRIKDYVPEPNESKILKELYAEFSQGRLGFESGSKWLADRGVSSRKGKLLSKSAMRRLLSNRRYIGVIVWKGVVNEQR